MWDWLSSWAESISWKDMIVGTLVGLLITSALQPFVLSAVTDIYVSAGAPGYTPPDLEVDYRSVNPPYQEGDTAPTYGDIEWQSDYKVYRLVVQNKGNKAARDIELYLPLPGCEVYTKKTGRGITGQYETSGVITARISGENASNYNSYECAKKITTERIYPGEILSVEFVVANQFEKCDILTGVHPRPEVTTEYRWEKGDSHYTEVEFRKFEELSNDYDQFGQNEGKGMEMGNVHGRRYLSFVIGQWPSFKSGLNQCGVDWRP